jgi:hypothetical protein
VTKKDLDDAIAILMTARIRIFQDEPLANWDYRPWKALYNATKDIEANIKEMEYPEPFEKSAR